MPLPKGTVRVFKEDQDDGSIEFIGEDSIGHTPKDEVITLTTGDAFDVIAEHVVLNRRDIPVVIGKDTINGYYADLRLTVWNHKDFEAEVVVKFNNYRGDNVKYRWNVGDNHVEKVSSSLYRITKFFKPNEKVTFLWSEDYRPS